MERLFHISNQQHLWRDTVTSLKFIRFLEDDLIMYEAKKELHVRKTDEKYANILSVINSCMSSMYESIKKKK